MAGFRNLLQQRMRFGIPTGTPASSSVMFPLAGVGINTLGAVSGVLEVIVYSKTLNNGVTAQVAVGNMVRTSDGRVASQDGQIASVAITTGSETDTQLLTEALTPPIGSMLAGVLIFETDGQSAGDGEIDLEVYLVTRDA